MGTSSWLATALDHDWLVSRRRGAPILGPLRPGAPPYPNRRGIDVASELDGRLLIKYIKRIDIGAFRSGTTRMTYATITAYSPEEAPRWLLVPDPQIPRPFVLLIDPARVDWIQGPMWTGIGSSIQYILPGGFPATAIVVLGAPTGRWEIAVR